MQRFTSFWRNLRNLHISQDICYVRMTDIVNILTIYGQRAHLLNNNVDYFNLHFTTVADKVKQSLLTANGCNLDKLKQFFGERLPSDHSSLYLQSQLTWQSYIY